MDSKLNQLEDSYDIVIAGFGPVGQFCSNIFNRYGIKVGAIEVYSNIYPEPRSISIDDEIQRLISSLGLWNKFKKNIVALDFADLIFPNGKVVLRGPVTSTSNGFPFVTTFYQPELESILIKNLDGSKCTDIFLGHEIINFKEEKEAITLSIKNLKSNKLLKIRTKYLLACDGSESFIRNKLKINLVDMKYNKEWLIVDAILQNFDEIEKVARYICDPERPTIFTVLTESRVRLEFQLLAGEKGEEMLKDNNISRLVSPLLKNKEYQIERTAIYRYRGNHANVLRCKNIFLLGDAAHQIPPFAGQGLSSGLRDAYNLCWKLAHVIKNGFKDEILDTYEIERIDQIKNTINSSIALGKLIDSLSIAFKNNTPLDEAVPPEAREQAYGKKSITDRSIREGLFSTLVQDSHIGKLIPMTSLEDKANSSSIDDLLDFRFAVISSKETEDLLTEETLKLFKEMNAVFINISKYKISNTKFQDLVDTGDIIVRPDKSIYGITSDKVTLQNLADELFHYLKN